MRKKIVVVSMVVMMLFLMVAGCSSNTEASSGNQTNTDQREQPTSGNGKEEFKEITICESWGFETGFSSVVVGEDLGIFYYLGNFYETLVNYEDGEIVPGLAERWDIEGNDITFYLRKDVKFSDGTDFNAEVVKKNFEMIPKMLGEMYIGIFGKVLTILDEVEVIDEYTVKLKLTTPYYGVLQELAMLRPMAMMSPNAFDGDKASNMLFESTMGTGPYMLDDFVDGQAYTFVKNPYYWGEEPNVDRFTVKVIPDNSSKALALRSGEIDMIVGANKISYDTFNDFSNNSKYNTKISEADIKTRYFALNSDVEPFNNEQVRKAAAHALSKKEICDRLMYGIEAEADSLLSKSLPYCDIDLVGYDYNLDKAKFLLEEEGWVDSDGDGIREKDGSKLQATIVYRSGMGVEEDIVLSYATSLKQIGFDLSVSGVEMITWYTDLAQGNFTIGYQETYGLPYDPYSSMHNISSTSQDPAASYVTPKNAEIDAKVEELLSTSDNDEIQDIYNYILETVQQSFGSIPVSHTKELVIFNTKNISDYAFDGQPSNVVIANVTLNLQSN